MARAKQRGRYTGEESGNMGEEFEMKNEESEGAMPTGQTRQSLLDAFDAFGGPMARVMEHNRTMLQKMMHAVQEESLKFVNRRLEHTGHAIESSRDCQGVSGLLAIQQEWMLDFARDYAEHTRRFAELMGELVEDGSTSLTAASLSAIKETRARTEAANGRRTGA
ncbi:MAG TPA: hypothetical protein VG274_04915 [Rhizomicrobium sp.]|nr:hypothetical protein [Rhizomicrobium sp.]